MAPCSWWTNILLTKFIPSTHMLIFSVVSWNGRSVCENVHFQYLPVAYYEAIHGLRGIFSIFVCRKFNDSVASVQPLIVFRQFNWENLPKRIEKLSYFLLGLGFQRTAKTSNINPIVLLAFDWYYTFGRQSVGSLMSFLLWTAWIKATYFLNLLTTANLFFSAWEAWTMIV